MSKGKVAKKARADRGKDKASIKARTDRAATVGTTAQNSPIWTAQPTLQDLGTRLIAAGTKLGTDEAKVLQLETAAATARTARDTDLVSYDALYGAYVSGAENYALTAQDLQLLGLEPAVELTYGITNPIDLTGKYDPTTQLVHAHVKRAPGMQRCVIEISSDQTFATNVKTFPGDGARQAMGGFTPGTYWMRALHVRAAERSGYTGLVAVIVK